MLTIVDTGERPYQCYLCSETFCRSDILKRHFQKCSVRRGNPSNVTHLTHAQAHLRKSGQATPPGPHPGGDVGAPGMDARQWHGPGHYTSYGGEQLAQRAMADGGPHDSSRGSSIIRPSSRNVASYPSIHNSSEPSPNGSVVHDDRKLHTPVYPQHQQVPTQPHGNDTSSAPSFPSTSTKTEAGAQSSYMPARSGYAPYPGGPNPHMHSAEWDNFFQPTAHDPMFSSA